LRDETEGSIEPPFPETMPPELDILLGGPERMIYVKSLLISMAALITYVLLLVAIAPLLVPTPASLPEGIGYVSNSPWIPMWLILGGALLVPTAAFYWTFKRISRAVQPPR